MFYFKSTYISTNRMADVKQLVYDAEIEIVFLGKKEISLVKRLRHFFLSRKLNFSIC
jgi:hypothetical protein